MTDGNDDWRPGGPGDEAWFAAGSHSQAAALAASIAANLPEGEPLPDLAVRPGGIRVGVGGSDGPRTRSDVSAAARSHGLTADPGVLQRVGLVIASGDPRRLAPFWRAAADVDGHVGGVLADDLRRRPTLRFARAEGTTTLRSRFHLDIGLPGSRDEAVPAALDAGGREAYASQWYSTLADPDGNEVDVVPGNPWEGGSTQDWALMFGAMVRYPVVDPRRAAAFALTVAGLADAAAVDLMIDLRADCVVIDSGKDRWEEVAGFADLAAAVQRAARTAGLEAGNPDLRFAQIALDAVDVPVVREFWRVVLGYAESENRSFDDIVDPRQLDPVLFFQAMDAADVDRLREPGRIRLDLQVPADRLAARVDAAVAAGGRVTEREATGDRYRVADPEGNEMVLRAARPSAADS